MALSLQTLMRSSDF
jgi:hypothetical protein